MTKMLMSLARESVEFLSSVFKYLLDISTSLSLQNLKLNICITELKTFPH